jgi:endonuclease/exonuclease/phosphatase family metal-dependent hydrolase
VKSPEAVQERPISPPAMPAVRRIAPIVVEMLSWLNLAGVLLILVLIRGVSERWWLGTALTYLPRGPYLLPELLLLPACLLWRRKRATCVTLLALAVVAGPVMGLQGNPLVLVREVPATDDELRVVCCNVQFYTPDFAQVLREIVEIEPHLVAFQESAVIPSVVKRQFHDWHIAHAGEFYVASRFPVAVVSTHFDKGVARHPAAKFRVSTPRGDVLVSNLHCTTPRHSLMRLRPASLISGAGARGVERHSQLRDAESQTVRRFVAEDGLDMPVLVLGDFNQPVDDMFFRRDWGEWNNAFATGGWGYGYTSPCDAEGHWPSNWPWVQVDHILTSRHWDVLRCWVGRSNGSDHRLIAARLRLREPAK